MSLVLSFNLYKLYVCAALECKRTMTCLSCRFYSFLVLHLCDFLLYLCSRLFAKCKQFFRKKFLSPEVDLDLSKSTLQPCMEYCCHSGLLPPVNQLEKYVCRIVGTTCLLPLLNPWLIIET